MVSILLWLINALVNVVTWLVIIHIVLSYFMDPFHPIRQAISSVVVPMLTPIRRVVPAVGMLDFSPLVLILLVQLIGRILTEIIRTIF